MKIGNLKNKYITADQEQTADTEKVFLSRQHYSKYYYRTPKSPTLPQSNTIWTGTVVPLYPGGFDEIEWTDSECEEEEDEELSHTHHEMSERKCNMVT